MSIGMRALEQLDDLFGSLFALGLGFSHLLWWSAGIPARRARSALNLNALADGRATARYCLNFPVSISASIFQSPMNDQSGCVKVAGRFLSTKKCAVQANA